MSKCEDTIIPSMYGIEPLINAPAIKGNAKVKCSFIKRNEIVGLEFFKTRTTSHINRNAETEIKPYKLSPIPNPDQIGITTAKNCKLNVRTL